MRGNKIDHISNLSYFDKYEIDANIAVFSNATLKSRDSISQTVTFEVPNADILGAAMIDITQQELDSGVFTIYEQLLAHPMSAMVEPPSAERSYRSDIYANKDTCRRDNHELVISYVMVNGLRQEFSYCKQCKKEAL